MNHDSNRGNIGRIPTGAAFGIQQPAVDPIANKLAARESPHLGGRRRARLFAFGFSICCVLFPIAATAECEIDSSRLVGKLSDIVIAARNEYFAEQCKRVNGELLDSSDPKLKGRIVQPSHITHPQGGFYPTDARWNRIQGVLQIAMVVEADGTIRDVTVLKSSGHQILDAAAVKGLSSARFQSPATLDGKPVRLMMTTEFRFKLR